MSQSKFDQNKDIAIEIDAKGKNVIPSINLGNIVTIHGKNGVGKSMAATLLEIASGNYIFENESKFEKLQKVILECEIRFRVEDQLIFSVDLKPHLWTFDKNLNRINPITLGDYFKAEKKKENEISFDSFSKKINIRTIRGDESLEQQIYFFKDVFIAKLDQKLSKLEKLSDFLENYKEKIYENKIDDLIKDYTSIQEKYHDALTKNNNLENSINNREASIKRTEYQLDLLEKIILIKERNLNDLADQKSEEIKKINKTKEEIQSIYEAISKIKNQISTFKTKLDENTKVNLKKRVKLKNQLEKLDQELANKFYIDLSKMEGKYGEKSKEITNTINEYQENIKEIKKKIEELNKRNQKVLKIKDSLTKLRDACSVASSYDFGDEGIVEFTFNNTKINFSFKELYEIFRRNNEKYRENEKLKEYKTTVQDYNEKIKQNRCILEALTQYDKTQKKVEIIEKDLRGKSNKIDDYLDVEDQIDSLKKKKDEKEALIKKLDDDIVNSTRTIEDLEAKIKSVKDLPSITSFIVKLERSGIKLTNNPQLVPECKERMIKINKELEAEKNKLEETKLEKQNANKKIKKYKDKLDPTIRNLREISKNYGYTEYGRFIEYFQEHSRKFKSYRENVLKLQTRLKVLREDLVRVIEGTTPKNKTHLKIINNQFNEIFKEIYEKPEFFEYVFKDYSKIKKFDFAEKTIIFETKDGLEEARDLEEFSSGEKTYAYCRSIISMAANVSNYNIVILDESYALLDHEHSQNLIQFQKEMIEKSRITKFINILPLKDDFRSLITQINKDLTEERKEIDSNKDYLENQLIILKDFQNDVEDLGYYQEINYPEESKKEINLKLGIGFPLTNEREFKKVIYEEKKTLDFSFVLDGSNIARSNQNSKKPTLKDVMRCKRKLMSLGVPEENIFIIFGSGLWKYLNEGDNIDYQNMLKSRNINQASAGVDDDWYIIKFAFEEKSHIITNDFYKEYKENYPEFKEFLETHCIRYNILGTKVTFEPGFEQKLKTIMNIQ